MRRTMRVSAPLFMIFGFGGVILVGTALLLMPFSIEDGQQLSFINALFTATSCVCVTGLSPIDVSQVYTGFGQMVTAILIHIGGLGFMSVAIVLFVAVGRKIGLKERVLLKESLGQNSIKGIVVLIKRIAIFSVLFELCGAAIVFPVFLNGNSPYEALKISLYHAVSAYNNAGYDIIGPDSLVPYSGSVTLNLVTMTLIVVGGLGFAVLYDIAVKKQFRKFTMHSKIVLCMTAVLIVLGAVLLKVIEHGRWMDMFFQSVTARTAGFKTIEIGQMTSGGIMVLIVLMFIGASPGSTGGGIKTTTFFTMLITAFSLARGKKLSAFQRKIPTDNVLKAFTIAFYAMCLVVTATFLVSLGNPEMTLRQVLFECVSAFGTVGLSTGVTGDLSVFSKAVIITTMFFGRLGPFTIACVGNLGHETNLDFVEENITVG